MARMGPIRGEINMEATSETVEFSTSPVSGFSQVILAFVFIPMKAIAAAATR